MSPSYLQGPGSFRFDVSLLKKIRLGEMKEMEIRGDAINILNTPQFGDPVTNINSTDFGRITSAGGNRRPATPSQFLNRDDCTQLPAYESAANGALSWRTLKTSV